jgi:HK97 family phage prohead protease
MAISDRPRDSFSASDYDIDQIPAAYKEVGEALAEHLETLAHQRGFDGPDLEVRTTGLMVEIRSANAQRRIGGLAAVFGHASRALGDRSGSFHEIIDPAFFNKSRGDGWPGVVARFEHRSDMLLGAVHSGTLQLGVTDLGLDYTVDLPECRSDIYELVTRGDVRNSSFAFQCYDDDWDYVNGSAQRTLRSGRLIDVAPVVNPAYGDTDVALRSLANFIDAPISDVERYCALGEVRKLLSRTDRPSQRLSGRRALCEIESRRWTPSVSTPRQRQAELLGKRWHKSPQQEWLEQHRT